MAPPSANAIRNAIAPDFPDVVRVGADAAGGVRWFVASRSRPGAWWLLVFDPKARSFLCSCPAEVEVCWHARRVLAYTKAEEAFYKRPNAPPNVSALCD